MTKFNIDRLDEKVLRHLEQRAARHGCSIEAELGSILSTVLQEETEETSLKDLLLAMPSYGEDADFQRLSDRGRDVIL